jgi:hypothetical protein
MKRFLDKIEKTDSCWLWTASLRGKTGYGAFKLEGKVIDAHRVFYIKERFLKECMYAIPVIIVSVLIQSIYF